MEGGRQQVQFLFLADRRDCRRPGALERRKNSDAVVIESKARHLRRAAPSSTADNSGKGLAPPPASRRGIPVTQDCTNANIGFCLARARAASESLEVVGLPVPVVPAH